MQIKPRQNLLEVWQSVARHSFEDGEWDWGEWGGRSSVADAERLLCLLYPATEITSFRLDDPDTTQEDVERSLRAAGDSAEIPGNLVKVLTAFMDRHRTGDSPTFSGGHYFTAADPAQELAKEQRETGVVDSYSMSVTLCLATLGFLKVYRTKTQRPSTLELIDRLQEATSTRLTAAMVALLRSFTVNVVDVPSPQGQSLVRLLGQGRLSERQVVQRFQDRFKALRAVISESVTLGLDRDIADQLRNDNRLFECGWSWSVVRDAPEVETGEPVGKQPQGVAGAVPYLYFTVVALDGIPDLFSERTLVLGLLNAEQQKLADALRLRWEITQQYWSAIARFGDGTWPLEEIPWRTTLQQLESEYFSLSVASILVHDLVRRRATDDDLTRTVAVMERLAERGRVTSGMTRDDPAIALHNPGISLPLLGSEDIGPAMKWTMSDFSAQLLKRTVQLCSLSRRSDAQDRLLRLAEDILEHLWQRRIADGSGTGLWDNVHAVYPESPTRQGPVTQGPVSWSITERVTECMVAAYGLYAQPPIRSAQLATLAREMISEAAHLFGKVQMDQPAPPAKSRQGEAMMAVEVDLRRARALVDVQPGTAYALALGVLTRLDSLARARENTGSGV
ncbi:SCO2524 family protein [Streptomyces longwoodensis]|uniref:SCO2524 family protein n=1 Tax=Streptomyces longwoodensis TaxID=68231 RepID=UPI0033FDDE9A